MRTLQALDGETLVVGVIGWPVRHSLSPPMQNAAFAELGLNWVYVPFEVAPDRVQQAVDAVRALGMVGINVTVPHKEAVARLVDELDPAAATLGSVNTVVNRDGHLVGYSTDGAGFVRSVEEAGEDLAGKRVALIGAGGSARAVAQAVAAEQPEALCIINRTFSRALELAGQVRGGGLTIGALPLESAQHAVQDAQVVIDTTPVGMHPHAQDAPVVPPEWLHEGQCVCDLVYRPRDTVLLRAARERGARTVSGAGMLVHQGAIALELWTGKPAPLVVMRQALLEALDARS